MSLWKECTDAPSKFNRNAIQNAPDPTVIAVTNVWIMDYGGTFDEKPMCIITDTTTNKRI